MSEVDEIQEASSSDLEIRDPGEKSNEKFENMSHLTPPDLAVCRADQPLGIEKKDIGLPCEAKEGVDPCGGPALKKYVESKSVSRKRTRYEGWEGEGMGGYMRVKNQKLRDQFAAEFSKAVPGTRSGADGLFRGVTIHVNGATRPSREKLRALVGEQGGLFETYLTAGAVTHIVSEQLAAATRLRFRKMVKSGSVHVVTPAWVVDSATAGRLLPPADYAVPGMTEPGQNSIASFFGGKPVVKKSRPRGPLRP